MDPILQAVVTIACALIASSGFWGVVINKMDRQSAEDAERQNKAQAEREAQRKLLIGLAHDRIVTLGMSYIERGYITQDEYENFIVYLYEPYASYGGNGSGAKVANEVKSLPIRKDLKDEDRYARY